MQKLLETVRKSALPGLWSQGVSLAREGAVLVESSTDDEVTVRVRAPGRAIAPTVVLYPGDDEWACDCGSKVDPCAHVAAAAIALAQGLARKGAGAGEKAGTAGAARLVYRFARASGGLTLSRFVAREGAADEPIRGSLASLLGKPGPAAALVPTHDDFTVDRVVASWPRPPLVGGREAELLAALASSRAVELDGKPVRASGERIAPVGVVEDAAGGGVVFRVLRDKRIDDVVARGIVRCGDTLHPIAEAALSGERLERLPLERVVPREELGELVTRVLPELGQRIAIDVRTSRLPSTSRGGRPRVLFELSQREQHTLSVVATLVYGDPPTARIDNGKLVHLQGGVPARDEPAERALVQRLRDELNMVPGRRVDLGGADAVRFAGRLKAWRGDVAGETEGEIFERRPLVPSVAIRDDVLDVTFEQADDPADPSAPKKRASAEAVLRAFNAGLDLVPLEGGGWAPLPESWLAQYGERVADLLAARDEEGKVRTAALPALGELCDALEAPRPPALERLAPLFAGFEGIPDAPLPADLTATLRPYQRVGVNWLTFLRTAGLGAVLADDMGLGKTLQTLTALHGKSLVVCPKSVVFNWAAELARFRPGLRACIYHGPRRTLDEKADVVLTTYAVLRMDAELLAAKRWDTLVLDEAQAIKNPDSQVARAAYNLKADFRVSLSGTPVENRLEELWSQLHFTNRGLLGGRSDFKERYEEPIAAGRADVEERLRRKVRPFVLRRLKRDVAPELPPRTDTTLYVELDERERSIYDAVRAATRKEVVERLAAGGSVLAVLEALLRLRQAACHSGLVPGQEASSSSKVERILEALEDAVADGHKALVFSQWTSLLDRVEPHLRSAGIPFERLDGSTTDRAGVVTRFQADDGPPVLLLSLKAGGTGLNLTAADHVFLMDPWWNPAVEDQAADRAHRIGQDRPVMVYRLVAKDTVEEGILGLQERKRALAEAALGEGGAAAGVTREDLLALLE